MKDLLLVVPSRGRPQNVDRLWKTMQATCRGQTDLVVGLDEDDPQLLNYSETGLDDSTADLSGGPEFVIESDLHNVVPWINKLAIPQADNYRFIGHIGDDNIPHTEGWDVAIMEALGKTPFAFGNDLYPTRPAGSLCCHVFMRSEVVRKLGYFGPPGIKHMYVDVAWMAWGVKTGITYLHDVIIEHAHFTTGKAPSDDVYMTSQNLIPSDLMRWHDYCNTGQLNADIAKIDPQAEQFSPEQIRKFNYGLNIPPSWGQPLW
jgi:hypothetical protein